MTGAVALVTGAGRGIGRATAEALAAEGFAVVLNDAAEDADLADAVAALREAGARVVAAPFDVADLAAHGPALDRIEAALGPLTHLVNNAGVGAMARGDPLDVTPASWDRCMAVNARAVFFLTQAVARRMTARPAPDGVFRAIVTVTSANAGAAAVTRAEYCASKAAAAMVAQCFAVRLGAEGVAVYDVRPGVIATDMTAPVMDAYAARIAAGLTLEPRAGTPGDVARAIATLATGRLPYATGARIAIDGGLLAPRF